MHASLSDRFTALCASAAITLVLLQSVALLGHPRPLDSRLAAQAGCPATQVR